MITRIVKLRFKSESIEEFQTLFEQNKQYIRHQPGCLSLELLADINDPHTYFTYSVWENEESLNNYTESELFLKVWPKTKSFLQEKPLAWSTTSEKIE